MAANLKSMISKVFYTPVQTVQQKNINPFAVSTFSPETLGKSETTYGKNTPVAGGYFAGYYNNKPNIVGQRLFILAWKILLYIFMNLPFVTTPRKSCIPQI